MRASKKATNFMWSGAFRVGKPLFHFGRERVLDFIEFLYPPVCLLCDDRCVENRWLCTACMNRLRTSMNVKILCSSDEFVYLKDGLFTDGVTTFWEFNSDLETLIHRVKYGRMKRLARFLGETAGSAMAKVGITPAPEAIVPVPLHKVRMRERGYNQSAWISMGLSGALSIPILQGALYRIRHTRTQTNLSGEQRQANVRNAFAMIRPETVRGKAVAIVDDVVTTGATMNACAEKLKDAGASSVLGIALARPLLELSQV
jgi:ComF family protein